MAKPITPDQHARVVLASHLENNTPDLRQYATFADPYETQGAAVKRYMAARKRAWKSPEKRQFPRHADQLASTRAYVEAYYRMNFKYETEGHEGGAAGYVIDLFESLNTNPTTWPETDEVLVEEI